MSQVKIRVLVGKNTGREIAIDSKEFVIGRGEGCHLRPKTDTVSRRHCALLLKDGKVFLRDLGSKNGTFVNGRRVEAEVDRPLSDGDMVKAGKLEFSMVLEAAAETKRVPTPTIKQVAARNLGRRPDGGQFEDDDVSDWLNDADTEERKRVADPETRQFRLDETDQIYLSRPPSSASGAAASPSAAAANAPAKPAASPVETVSDVADTKAEPGKKEKKEPGKLPKIAGNQSKDSRTAAEQTLKKFFNRR